MSKALFNIIYKGGTEALKALNGPRLKAALKRKYAAAYDSVQSQIDDANAEVEAAREDLKNFNPQIIVTNSEKLSRLNAAAQALRDDYKRMFNEDMPEIEVEADLEENGEE